jgi:hypothetical protein
LATGVCLSDFVPRWYENDFLLPLLFAAAVYVGSAGLMFSLFDIVFFVFSSDCSRGEAGFSGELTTISNQLPTSGVIEVGWKDWYDESWNESRTRSNLQGARIRDAEKRIALHLNNAKGISQSICIESRHHRMASRGRNLFVTTFAYNDACERAAPCLRRTKAYTVAICNLVRRRSWRQHGISKCRRTSQAGRLYSRALEMAEEEAIFESFEQFLRERQRSPSEPGFDCDLELPRLPTPSTLPSEEYGPEYRNELGWMLPVADAGESENKFYVGCRYASGGSDVEDLSRCTCRTACIQC